MLHQLLESLLPRPTPVPVPVPVPVQARPMRIAVIGAERYAPNPMRQQPRSISTTLRELCEL